MQNGGLDKPIAHLYWSIRDCSVTAPTRGGSSLLPDNRKWGAEPRCGGAARGHKVKRRISQRGYTTAGSPIGLSAGSLTCEGWGTAVALLSFRVSPWGTPEAATKFSRKVVVVAKPTGASDFAERLCGVKRLAALQETSGVI